jgi:hypothetical protein
MIDRWHIYGFIKILNKLDLEIRFLEKIGFLKPHFLNLILDLEIRFLEKIGFLKPHIIYFRR